MSLIIVTALIGLYTMAVTGLFLWLGARLAGIPDISYRRALGTYLVIWLVQLPLMVPAVLLSNSTKAGPDAGILMAAVLLAAIGMMAAGFVVPWLLIKWLLRTSLKRSAVATVIMLVGSTVVSFAAALAFRATAAEAFVVPAGSMAPAIYGAHTDLTCDNCGMQYAVSRSSDPYPIDGVLCACPNCGHSQPGPAGASILSGDRVLADKIVHPKRWDLIVFRYPEDPKINYVKRLVGMPGETLEIADGDLFANGTRLRKEPGDAPEMWLFAHDTRCVAKDVPQIAPQWKAPKKSQWTCNAGTWTLAAASDDAEQILSFSGRLNDQLAYNTMRADWGRPTESAPLVGDVKLETWIEQFSGEGSLAFRWRFQGRRVIATISAAGEVEIQTTPPPAIAREPGETVPSATGHLSGGLSQCKHLEFAFRDGHAYVRENGRVVASLVVGPQDLATAKDLATQSSQPCRLEIVGRRCSVTLGRIVLWKDVYYRNLTQMFQASEMSERQWGCTDHPITLEKGEYFTLGDNSSQSKDSRFWGVVPSQLVIGVVRWTYWPRSRWHEFP